MILLDVSIEAWSASSTGIRVLIVPFWWLGPTDILCSLYMPMTQVWGSDRWAASHDRSLGCTSLGYAMSCCDNPVVGKHLDENTRLLAEIYCSLRYVFGCILAYFSLYISITISALRALFILCSSFGPSVCTPTAYRTWLQVSRLRTVLTTHYLTWTTYDAQPYDVQTTSIV